jgi:pimeloyl-ACP methyl ester carboxylesterase
MFNIPRHLKPSRGKELNEIVILVHGLFLRGITMYIIGRYLRGKGYEVYVYEYFTTRKNIARHGVDFAKYIERVISKRKGMPVHVVTHSLGSIVAREALYNLEQKGRSPVKRLVMLAPPNKGSDVAEKVVRIFPFFRWLVKPLPELSSAEEAYIHLVPSPSEVEIGIIAGAFDGKVAVEYTYMRNQKAHTIVPRSHTFMIYDKGVREMIYKFLREGTF